MLLFFSIRLVILLFFVPSVIYNSFSSCSSTFISLSMRLVFWLLLDLLFLIDSLPCSFSLLLFELNSSTSCSFSSSLFSKFIFMSSNSLLVFNPFSLCSFSLSLFLNRLFIVLNEPVLLLNLLPCSFSILLSFFFIPSLVFDSFLSWSYSWPLFSVFVSVSFGSLLVFALFSFCFKYSSLIYFFIPSFYLFLLFNFV